MNASALFVVPVAVIYPFKVLALYAIAEGYVAGGVTAFVNYRIDGGVMAR